MQSLMTPVGKGGGAVFEFIDTTPYEAALA
jgi:hypothetical protein